MRRMRRSSVWSFASSEPEETFPNVSLAVYLNLGMISYGVVGSLVRWVVRIGRYGVTALRSFVFYRHPEAKTESCACPGLSGRFGAKDLGYRAALWTEVLR